jgi:toxin ParE1/3/4
VADVHLSRRAYADLAGIDAYGASEFGPDAADAYQDAFDKAFARLADFPHIGEARPAYGPGIRCLVCGQHRILYKIVGNTVQIICILHHSQDVTRRLPR